MKPEWVVLATRDVKNEYFSLTELLSWVKDNVPEGTSNDDIRLEVDVDDTTGYYDDIIIDATMKLSVRKV